jgi:hypothetical protein
METYTIEYDLTWGEYFNMSLYVFAHTKIIPSWKSD